MKSKYSRISCRIARISKSPTMILWIAGLFILVGLTSTAYARAAIKDVEYLRGEDFVQLRFITDKIISIPDVFYPEEGNIQRLVMRIGEVDFNSTKDSFRFNSPVIESVDLRKKDNYTDVEIRLKERVNYRVFTNRNGLYIEFPNVKTARAGRPVTPPKSQERNYSKPKPEKAITTSKPAYSPTPTSHLGAENNGKLNFIRDIKVTEKNADKVKVEFVMARSTDYKVIPVFDKPVRLAIDLENTHCRGLQKSIDYMNVKQVRGAANTPTVFRVVFDLHYLKSYSVSLNKNVLEVEFYNLSSLANNKKRQGQDKDSRSELELAYNAHVNNKTSNGAGEKSEDLASETITNESLKAMEEKDPIEHGSKDGNGNGNGNGVVELSPRTVLTTRETKNSDEFFSEERAVVPTGESKTEESTASETENADDKAELGSLFKNRTINEGKKEWSGELRSYHLKNQDLQNLLIHFARDTGISMVFDPDISGSVTAELNNVPWDQALDIFLRQNGLGMERDGNVIRIAKIDKLEKEAEQRRKLKETRQKEVELATRTHALNYAQANDVKAILDKSLSTRGNILTDIRSNTLIISEVPENFPILEGLIESLDTPTPQVSIAAKIIETNSNYTKNLGIQWGFNFLADSAYGNQTTLKFPNSIGVYGNGIGTEFLGPLGGYAVNFPAAGANSGVSFSLGNVSNTFRLDVALSAMQRRGKGRIIQSPRFVTQNNIQARISQGYKIPIQTVQNNTVTVQYMDATLQLTVVPTITADDTITMQIDIKNDNVDWGNVVDERPSMLTQSAKTTVKAKNGETIVIGGMYKVETGTSRESIPLLHKLPIIGNLFKNSNRSTQQRKTLIFITPRIIR